MIWQKIKQIDCNTEPIYLLNLLLLYLYHQPRFEWAHWTLYQAYKHSINFIKPTCYCIQKSKSEKMNSLKFHHSNGEKEMEHFSYDLNKAYEKVVFQRKDLFILPTGKTEKKYIKISLESWTHGYKICHLRLLLWKQYTMFILLLQKPSRTSKKLRSFDYLQRKTAVMGSRRN